MSESADTGSRDTESTESQGHDSETTDEAELRPAVQAARAQAEAQIDKARGARSAAARKDNWILGTLAALSGGGAFFGGINWALGTDGWDGSHPYSGWWPVGSLALFTLLVVVYSVRATNRSAAYDEVVRAEELNIRMAELDYMPDTDAPLSANRELLREYHRLSTSQARSAFRLATWVMGAAAVLIVAGAGGVLIARNTTTAVTLASLTAFISALSGYVSATLLTTYRISVEQARFYFREPLAGGYLLAAEHLAKRVPAPNHIPALQRVVDGFIQAAVNVPGVGQDAATPQDPQGPATSA